MEKLFGVSFFIDLWYTINMAINEDVLYPLSDPKPGLLRSLLLPLYRRRAVFVPPAGAGFILLEDGFKILLENQSAGAGDSLRLEG